MKLLLHYLWFDWKRNRELFLALWILLSLHVVLYWLGSRELKEPWVDGSGMVAIPASWQKAAFVCRLLILLCAVVLSISSGGVDSPVRATAWQITRPGRGWRLAGAHWLGIMLGVVLPLTACYTGALAMVHFDGLTILSETLVMLAFLAAACSMLMVWAAVSPLFSGVVLGCGVAAVAGLSLSIFDIEIPDKWRADGMHPAVIMLILMMPALCGWRRAPGPRARLLAGMGTGAMLVAAIHQILPVRDLNSWAGPDRALERRVFGTNEETWPLTTAAPATVDPGWSLSAPDDGGLISLDVESAPADENLYVTGSVLEEISWRASTDGAWSDWHACGPGGGVSRKSGPLAWKLDLRLGQDAISSMDGGELRVRAKLKVVAPATQTIVPVQGAVAKGRGWVLEVVHVEGEERLSVQTVFRSAIFSRTGAFHLSMATGSVASLHSGITGDFWDGARDFARPDFAVFGVQASTEKSPPDLTVHYLPAEQKYSKILHITGVKLTLPHRPVTPLPKSDPVPVERASEGGGGIKGAPVEPWPNAESLRIPAPDAAAAEVRAFLSRLAADGSLEDSDTLVDRVPQWLPLLLEAETRFPARRVRELIVAGAGEGQRDEILKHLPDAPALVEVVLQRGWTAEAKPWILRLVGQRGKIPDNLLTLCRSYRDPAFNDVMRRSFSADWATVAYWESMPELAAELPQRLAEERNKWLRSDRRFANPVRVGILLRSGDREVLDALLKSISVSYPQSFAPGMLNHFVRTADGRPLSPETVLQSRSAADFEFDARGHFFFPKKKTP